MTLKDFLFAFNIFLTLVIAVVASRGELVSSNKKLTKLAYTLAVSIVLSFAVQFALYIIGNDEQEKFLNALRLNDSTQAANYALKLDSNNSHTTDLLAKYGYKVDSANDIIVKKLSDSALNKDEPGIAIRTLVDTTLKIVNKTAAFRIYIGNPSPKVAKNINLKVTSIILKRNGYIHSPSVEVYTGVDIQPYMTDATTLYADISNITELRIFVVVSGTFENNSGKSFRFHQVGELNLLSKQWSVINGDTPVTRYAKSEKL